MPVIGTDFVTFLDGLDELEELISAKVPRRQTPYYALKVHSHRYSGWYSLTIRDLARTALLCDPRRPGSMRIDDAVSMAGWQQLAVNQPGESSVMIDDAGVPNGIVLSDRVFDPLSITVAPTRAIVSRRRRGGPRPKATPDASPEVTRTPHLELLPRDGSIMVGGIINVQVFADTDPPTEGEESESITLDPGGAPMQLDVRLETSAHLRVEGNALQRLTINPAVEKTETLSFAVTVMRETAPQEHARITAYFSHLKRPCGLVRRQFEIGLFIERSHAPQPPTEPPLEPPNGIRVGTGVDADLLVIVRDPSGDLQHLTCEVHTRLLADSEYVSGPVPWTLNLVTPEIVRGIFRQFEEDGISRIQRTSRLDGAGWDLFDKAPRNFVDLLWKLLHLGKPLKTIAVVSEEPYIPWELMVPVRYVNSLPEFRELPLGVEFAVARWTAKNMIMAPQVLPLSRSLVVAPRYKDPLKHSEEEVQVVLARVPGERIDPADLDSLDAKLSGAQASLLHFACHGVAVVEDNEGHAFVDVQGIRLEGTHQDLDSRMVKGMKSFRKFCRQRPLVVLNACELGRPSPALNGVGGFANSFTNLGAGGVIAPLWSVDDEVAFKVATAIYDALKESPPPTFAEVIRAIRARAYVGAEAGTDSYAAYCFYGDPLARPG